MNKGLNSTTIQQVKEILLKAPSLQNKASLRALFRDVRLNQWYSIVPDASNTNEQIDALLDQLIDLENDQRENALALFLLVVSDQPATPRSDKLRSLAQQVSHELGLPDPRHSPPPPSTGRIRPDDPKPRPRPRPNIIEILRRAWQTIPLSLRWLAGVGLLIPLSLWLVAQIPFTNLLSPTPAPTEKVAQATPPALPPPASPTQTVSPSPTQTVSPSPMPTRTTTPIPTLPPLGIGSTLISPKDGMVQVYVPAGSFLRGASPSDDLAEGDEFPQREVYLDAFWIDQYEVSNQQFALFVADSSYETTAEQEGGVNWQHPQGANSDLNGLDSHPVVQVSWEDANAYCVWAGRRLPTEAEWEKAARGTAGQIYPWGDEFDATKLNADGNADGYALTSPVGSYPAGGSPYGALDMAGNVWEWVNDWYSNDYYATSPDQNPQGPDSGNARVLRGGSWDLNDNNVRASLRNNVSPPYRLNYIGFRCVQEGFSP